MAFAIAPFVLGGTTFSFGNGIVVHDLVEGNVKQFSAGEWRRIPIPNKDKLKLITWSGTLGTDELKSSLEGFRDNNSYKYTDLVFTGLTVVVIDLTFDHDFSPSQGHELWNVRLVLEEFSQG